MLTRRNITLAALAATLVPAAAGAAHAVELTKASLRLKWLPQAQFAGYYVALEKGYFKDAGIDLTINPGGPNLLTENLVATGADTFGVSGGTDSLFAARDKGLPVVGIGISHQETPFVFVSRKDGPVKTIKDFKGRAVTTWFTGANHVLNGVLRKEGVDPGEVKIQPQQVSVTPFVDGSIDVVTATFYNELYTIETRVDKTNLRLFKAEDYGITVPRDTVIASEATLKDKPQLVTAFLKASIRGWREAFGDPKGAVDIVMKIAPTLDRAHQEFQLTEVKRLMLAGKAAQDGLFSIDPAAVKSAHDFFLEYKVFPKPIDLKAAFDPRPLEAIPAADKRV